MRKIFTTLKSVVAATLVAAMTLAASCTYDDTVVKNDLEKIKSDLAALTERVAALETKLDSEVASLQSLINGKVVVTGVATENGVTTVSLSDGSSFVIDNNKPETTKADDYTIGAYVDGDVYYWAVFVNGEFKEFLLVNDEKVAVFAEGCDCEEVTPVEPCKCELAFSVDEESGNLLVSIDGGANWVDAGIPAEQVSSACVFTGVVVDGDKVTFTLADGTTFDVQKAELVEFEAAKSALYVKVGETKSIPFAINDAVEDINVMNTPMGWKASVEAATRAVGGMDYVLNISGPAKDFAAYADKSGKVAIHFNTAAGACKVMSIDVELASIDLQVDKAGNITINSTLVDEYDYTDWYGETEHIVEFNNFYLAVFDLDTYYEINGDLESVYNASWGEFNIPAAAGYINNIVTNIGENSYEEMTYVDGENEKWTITSSVENVLSTLDWYDQLPYEGNSFMVCVIPTDINANGSPVWADTIAVPFKQLSISVVENVDARAFNNVYFDATLRGALSYHIYPVSQADIDLYVEEYQYYDSMEAYFFDALQQYLLQPDWYQFGFEITSDVVETNISLAELIAYTTEYNYFELAPNTEYVMCIFVEEDGKTEYTVEDLIFVNFATADITPAETPMEISYEAAEEQGLYTIAVDVTVPETVCAAYTRWYDEILDDEALMEDIIANGYGRDASDFEESYTFYVGTSVDEPATAKYLGILLIDAEGNYTMELKEFKSDELVINTTYTPTIESVTFDEEGAHITVGGLTGADVKAYKYYIISTTGGSYYQRTEEELYDVAYSDDWMYKSSDVNPIVATSGADYSSITFGTYKVAVGIQFADGTYSNTVYGEFVYENNVEAVALEMVVGEGSTVRYTANNSTLRIIDAAKTYCVDLYLYNIINSDKMYLPVGTYVFGTNYGEMYVYGYSRIYDYAAGGWNYNFDAAVGGMTVSEVDGAYHLEISGSLNQGAATIEFVYDGAIENLILPSQYKEPEKLDFAPVRAEYDFMFDLYEYNQGDAEYAFWLYDANDNALEVICHYGSHTNWDYNYEATYYGQDGTTFTATKVATQKPNTYNCEEGQLYFVVTASSIDYEVSYTGQLTATEVNYLGEGSTYPF